MHKNLKLMKNQVGKGLEGYNCPSKNILDQLAIIRSRRRGRDIDSTLTLWIYLIRSLITELSDTRS